MPGYTLVEQSALKPYRGNGIAPLAEEIGLLDLLRELTADDFPFARFTELRVIGLEQVLYAARPNDARVANEIRRRLQESAQDLQRRLLSIQIVFQGELKRGDSLWCEYRGQRLPIGNIFGTPHPQTDSNGNRFFTASFNLTS